MVSPNPSPCGPSPGGAPCRSCSKTWGKTAGVMPRPVSRTVTCATAPVAATETSIAPPSVNFSAFVTTFKKTCRSRSASANSVANGSTIVRRSTTPFSSAIGCIVSTTSCTISPRLTTAGWMTTVDEASRTASRRSSTNVSWTFAFSRITCKPWSTDSDPPQPRSRTSQGWC